MRITKNLKKKKILLKLTTYFLAWSKESCANASLTYVKDKIHELPQVIAHSSKPKDKFQLWTKQFKP